MEYTDQQNQSTRSSPMGIIPGNSERERALRADSALFQTITIRGVTTTRCHADSAADAADPNAWANILDEMAHGRKYARSTEDKTRTQALLALSLLLSGSA